MSFLQQVLHCFSHLNVCLSDWATVLGVWLYVALFLVVFCETGLVVTPFLPGDSLLFATGALCALGPLKIHWVILLLVTAAVLGDAVNYAIGYRVGPRVFTEKSRWLRQDHLIKTQQFYEKHGGKTIIIARFVPIIRTFAPFVAGIGKMRYARFAAFNVVGGVAWVVGFTVAGYLFGNHPAVKRNFQYVIMAIIVVSVMPIVIEFLKARRESARPAAS